MSLLLFQRYNRHRTAKVGAIAALVTIKCLDDYINFQRKGLPVPTKICITQIKGDKATDAEQNTYIIKYNIGKVTEEQNAYGNEKTKILTLVGFIPHVISSTLGVVVFGAVWLPMHVLFRYVLP